MSYPRVSANPYPANYGHGRTAFDRGWHESMNGMVFGSNPYRRYVAATAWSEGWLRAREFRRTNGGGAMRDGQRAMSNEQRVAVSR